MQKSVVRGRPGNLVGRKQNKQYNKENKEGPTAFLNIEYRGTSAGPQTKASSKDTLAKPEDLKGCFSPCTGGREAAFCFSFLPIKLPHTSLLPTNRETTNNNQNN